jgi:hypothetical protein
MLGVDDVEDKIAGLVVTDSPATGDRHRRVFVGKGGDGIARVALADANGKQRIVMQVTAGGTPSLTFLDAEGKVVGELPARKGSGGP